MEITGGGISDDGSRYLRLCGVHDAEGRRVRAERAGGSPLSVPTMEGSSRQESCGSLNGGINIWGQRGCGLRASLFAAVPDETGFSKQMLGGFNLHIV